MYVKNILLALGIMMVLFFILVKGLNIYTCHGKQVIVPDVKGMQVEQAGVFFHRKKLNYAVVDSIYARNKPAGSILETIPPGGTNVKEGRTIYLTVNAATAQMLTVPQVVDVSRRQAETTLRSLGFETIRIKSVPGQHKDLVLGLENARGVSIDAGSRLPADTHVFLLVCSGNGEILGENEPQSKEEE